jgi:hypothetical protein
MSSSESELSSRMDEGITAPTGATAVTVFICLSVLGLAVMVSALVSVL